MKWLGLLGVVLGVSGISCGSSANGVSDAGSEAAVAPDATATVEVSGTVIESSDGAPIAGANVCIVDYLIPCAITDTTGAYTIALPPLTSPLDIAFNISAPGHLGVTFLDHETLHGLSWPGQVPLGDDASAATLLGHAGFTYPSAGTGFIQLFVGAGHIGVTPVVSPKSGTGPVYFDSTGTPDPTLTAVTSDGYVLFGNLTPGKVEITASSPCDVIGFSDSWTETKPGTVTGQVIGGSITQMSLICGNE